MTADPTLQALIDRLADATSVDGPRVGEVGRRSEGYATYEAIVERAQPDVMVALLEHASPIVRGYFARHVAAPDDEPVDALEPLLRDATEVQQRLGGLYARTTIAGLVADGLCRRLREERVVDLLTRAVRDTRVAIRARLLRCVAAASDEVPAARRDAVTTLVDQVALGWLGDRSDEARRADAVLSLQLAGATRALPRLEDHATDPSPAVRARVATAVGTLGGRVEVVELLTRDADPDVRRAAGAAYVAMNEPRDQRIRALLDDPVPRVRDSVTEALAQGPLATRYLPALLAAPGAHGRTMQRLAERDDPALAPLMRSLLEAESGYVRERATAWLGAHGDASDVPRIRARLSGAQIGERTRAAQILGERRDRASFEALSRMLEGDDNPHGRIAAAEALVAIDPVAARPLVEAALRAESTWARPRLEAALEARSR